MRSHSRRDPIGVLEHLLALCADSVDGYRRASRAVHDPAIRRVLDRNAANREESARIFTDKLAELGHEPEDHYVRDPSRRCWSDAVGLVERESTLAVLRACAVGEREMLIEVCSTLGLAIPADVHALIKSLFEHALSASAALQREVLDIVEPRHIAPWQEPKEHTG